MTLVCLAAMLAEICMYYAVAAYVFTLIGLEAPVMLSAMAVFAACAGSFLLREKKPLLRCLPLALLALCFVRAGTVCDVLLPLPMCLYAVLSARKTQWVPDYYRIHDLLKHFWFVCPLLLPLAFLSETMAVYQSAFLPFYLMWLLLCFMLLRILRHEDFASLGRRFQVLNLLTVGGVCLLGAALNSRPVRRVIGLVISGIYNVVIRNLLMGLVYLVIGLLRGVGKVFSIQGLSQVEFQLENVELDLGETGEEAIGDYVLKDTPPALRVAFFAVVIVLFLVLAWLLVRRMLRARSRAVAPIDPMQRDRLDTAGTGARRPLFGGTPRDKLRGTYRRFLLLCQRMGIPVEGELPSDEIARRAAETLPEPQVEQLRALWLPARYDPAAEISSRQAREAKAVYNQLKAEYGREKAAE